MTVAVTGASGHLGANLVRALLAQGRNVRVLVHRDRREAVHEPLPRASAIERRVQADVRPDEQQVRIDEVLADHVHEVRLGAVVGQHHAVAERLAEAAGALADQALQGVGLLEVGVVGVEDDRLPRGERLVALTWIQSFVRDAAQRELLYELDQSRQQLLRTDPQSDVTKNVDRSYVNLLRMWAEV